MRRTGDDGSRYEIIEKTREVFCILFKTKQLKMSTWFLLTALVRLIHGMGTRDGILTATYQEVLLMKQHEISYLHRPLIVTDSVQSQWSLVDNLEEVFGPEYMITADQQTTNCSCLEQTSVYDGTVSLTDLCEHYASALLYKGTNDNHYKYWERFEGI